MSRDIGVVEWKADSDDGEEEQEPIFVSNRDKRKAKQDRQAKLKITANTIDEDESEEALRKRAQKAELERLLKLSNSGMQKSLLATSADLREKEEAERGDREEEEKKRIADEEAKIMADLNLSRHGLASAKELAHGWKFKTPMPRVGTQGLAGMEFTSWEKENRKEVLRLMPKPIQKKDATKNNTGDDVAKKDDEDDDVDGPAIPNPDGTTVENLNNGDFTNSSKKRPPTESFDSEECTPNIVSAAWAENWRYDPMLSAAWRPPRKYRKMSRQEQDEFRENILMEVGGEDLDHIPPIKKFSEMRLPQGILEALKAKKIKRPTQIQMQGIPAALCGRDVIGIAFTGSGKTMVFLIPMVMKAIEMEFKKETVAGEGPFCVMMAPSRELADQIWKNLEHLFQYIHADTNSELYRRGRQLRGTIVMGGLNPSPALRIIQNGIHILVATPGRLNHLLKDGKIHVKQCQIFALDEADRMVEDNFEEEIRTTLDFFHGQRQTLLCSATMPRKVQDFAASMLVSPVIINVGRAGAANRDILQDVEYIKQEDKHKGVLRCLNKTPPPVLVFCDNKSDVDDVHEYLLLKGVDACAIHGGLDQEERLDAINAFKRGEKTVLIGTDVASKGLDFPEISHVINFDMPREIENYIHRIGRTGRRGKAGYATTFINLVQCTNQILLDLKMVLVEAGQAIHPILEKIAIPDQYSLDDIGGVKGCAYCGGLGHRVTNCPKLQSATQESGRSKDNLVGGNRYGNMAQYSGDW